MDKYGYAAGAIYVKHTDVILLMEECTEYMVEVHRNTLRGLIQRWRDNDRKIARSYHQQITALLKRALPVIQERNSDLAGKVVLAVRQAERIEAEGKRMMEAERAKRTKGNVVEVKSL